MSDIDDHVWKRLRPVWIGGLLGLLAGVVMFAIVILQPLEDRKAYVPAHDIYGGLRLLDLRRLPFFMPIFGLLLGLLVKMYRDAVIKHHRRSSK